MSRMGIYHPNFWKPKGKKMFILKFWCILSFFYCIDVYHGMSLVRKLESFRLTAPAAVLGHLGAISQKLPNFLTTSQDVTKGADQANKVGHLLSDLCRIWCWN